MIWFPISYPQSRLEQSVMSVNVSAGWSLSVRVWSMSVRFRSMPVRFRSIAARFWSTPVRFRSKYVRFRTIYVRFWIMSVRFWSISVRFWSLVLSSPIVELCRLIMKSSLRSRCLFSSSCLKVMSLQETKRWWSHYYIMLECLQYRRSIHLLLFLFVF